MKRATLFLFLVLPISLSAQFKNQAGGNFASHLRAQSLIQMLGLDPARFSMSQSFTMSYAALGSRTFSQGLYLNTMRYQIAEPLSVALQVGMAGQPLALPGSLPMMNNGFFVSGAQLLYRPTQNSMIRLEFSRMPTAMSPYHSAFSPAFEFEQ